MEHDATRKQETVNLNHNENDVLMGQEKTNEQDDVNKDQIDPLR